MRILGIFVKIFERDVVVEVLEVVQFYGFIVIQFNMSCLGLFFMLDYIFFVLLEEVKIVMDCFGM